MAEKGGIEYYLEFVQEMERHLLACRRDKKVLRRKHDLMMQRLFPRGLSNKRDSDARG